MIKIKWILLSFLLVVLIYTRFINLSWGLPYPMHPDERNMANAIQQLKCEIPISNSQETNKFQISQCLNPNFFAYGQFPLYTGFGIIHLMKFFDGDLGTPISFEEAVLSLRIISALASILNVLILMKLVNLLISNHEPDQRSVHGPVPNDSSGTGFPINSQFPIFRVRISLYRQGVRYIFV